MFNDPIEVTVGAVATDLARVALKDGSCTYSTPTGELVLTISHSLNKNRTRCLVRLDKMVDAPSLVTGFNSRQKLSCYFVCDFPSLASYDLATSSVVETALELTSFLSANTGGVVTRVVGMET